MTNADSVAQTHDNGTPDVPTTTNERYSLLANLPERFADDTYARYLAEQCDLARAQRDEARDKLHDLLGKAAELEGERNVARAQLRGVQMWTPRDIAATALVIAGAVYFVLAVVIDIVNAITTGA